MRYSQYSTQSICGKDMYTGNRLCLRSLAIDLVMVTSFMTEKKSTKFTESVPIPHSPK